MLQRLHHIWTRLSHDVRTYPGVSSLHLHRHVYFTKALFETMPVVTLSVRVRTYPTKNFTTLGLLLLRSPFPETSFVGSPVIKSPTSLTFRYFVGINPYTWSSDFVETCVFGKQSLEAGHCVPLCEEVPFSRSSLERVVLHPPNILYCRI